MSLNLAKMITINKISDLPNIIEIKTTSVCEEQ